MYDTTALCIRKTKGNIPKSSFFFFFSPKELRKSVLSLVVLKCYTWKFVQEAHGQNCQIQLTFSVWNIFLVTFSFESIPEKELLAGNAAWAVWIHLNQMDLSTASYLTWWMLYRVQAHKLSPLNLLKPLKFYYLHEDSSLLVEMKNFLVSILFSIHRLGRAEPDVPEESYPLGMFTPL